MRRRVIYDGDPGIDDALAILLAAGVPDAELFGVTTVAGNAPLQVTTKNALNVLEKVALRRDVPVAAGFSRALLGEMDFSYRMHGSDGLAETFLPDPETEKARIHATDQIIQSIRQNKGKITMVSAGPLTNLAIAILKEPDLKDEVESVVIMGGCIRAPGNVSKAAEFNIHSDPPAAHIVFESGLPITLVSLDLTTKKENTLTRQHYSEIDWRDSPHASFTSKLLRFYIDATMRLRGVEGCHLHDPLAMLVAIYPDLIQDQEKIYVAVELQKRSNLGRIRIDPQKNSSAVANISHIIDIDIKKAWDIFFETLNA
ncbi:nucleoside hydrolase [[Eubacterium] cellulosolvens]